jgi:hypothetical protein
VCKQVVTDATTITTTTNNDNPQQQPTTTTTTDNNDEDNDKKEHDQGSARSRLWMSFLLTITFSSLNSRRTNALKSCMP